MRQLLTLCGLAWLCLLATTSRADSVTIYHVGVGQGDATIIRTLQANAGGGTDTTVMLIDAGNSSGKGTQVYECLAKLMGANRHLNYAMVSHLHSDHLGGMAQVLALMKDNSWKLDFIVDRGGPTTTEDLCYDKDGEFIDNDNEPEELVLPTSAVYSNYGTAVRWWQTNRGTQYVTPAPGADLLAMMKRPATMHMTCVISRACVLTTYPTNANKCYSVRDENDTSLGFLFDFQGFKYFTAGDIGGMNGGGHSDLETPIAQYFSTFPNPITFHFCNFKVSHHGSGYSTNPTFLKCAQPSFAVVSSALRSFNRTQIPTESTISALLLAKTQIIPTYNSAVLYQGTVSNYIDVEFSVQDPGFDKAITMTVTKAVRSKASPYALTGTVEPSTLSCTKPHTQPPTPTALVATTLTATAASPFAFQHREMEMPPGAEAARPPLVVAPPRPGPLPDSARRHQHFWPWRWAHRHTTADTGR